jgi:hypothetical protein
VTCSGITATLAGWATSECYRRREWHTAQSDEERYRVGRRHGFDDGCDGIAAKVAAPAAEYPYERGYIHGFRGGLSVTPASELRGRSHTP